MSYPIYKYDPLMEMVFYIKRGPIIVTKDTLHGVGGVRLLENEVNRGVRGTKSIYDTKTNFSVKIDPVLLEPDKVCLSLEGN